MTINAPVASSARASLTTTGGGGGGFDFNTIAGLVAWYDASDASTITASAGKVSQWNNRKTGSSAHLTQGTGASQPTIGTRTQGGKNVLDFVPYNQMSATLPASTSMPYTIVCVCLTDNAAATQVQAFANTSTYLAGGAMNMYDGGAVTGQSVTGSTAYIMSWLLSTASCATGLNGGAMSAAGGLGSGSGFGTTLEIGGQGGSNGWDGWIAEWLVYASLSEPNRVIVRDELRTKWSVY